MNAYIRKSVTAVVAAVVSLVGLTVPATADEHLSTAEHCISLNRIESTEVLDGQTILFHMRGGDAYLNRLPHKCPGLDFEERFMYRSTAGQLCDLDIITVLLDSGFAMRPGASCGLGMFNPVSEEDAELISQQQ